MYLWHSSVHRATILRPFDTQAYTARSFWPYLTLKRTPCDDLISILFDAQAYTVRPFWLSLTLKRAPCDHFDILWHSSGEICSGPLGKTSPPPRSTKNTQMIISVIWLLSVFGPASRTRFPGPAQDHKLVQELAHRNLQTGTFRQELSDRNFQTGIFRHEQSNPKRIFQNKQMPITRQIKTVNKI